MASNGVIGKYDDLLFDEAENINEDKDYWFKIRGSNHNPLIDCATTFFGLSLRVKSLSECENIERIYKQTIEEINIIEIDLSDKNYDHSVLMAYRYILCTFLDEAVMGTKWGGASVWAEYSMLSRFHNETWGGEKFFTILSKLEKDPERYKDLLEFIYYCLILGFEGKFKVLNNGREAREKVIKKLYSVLNSKSESKSLKLTSDTKNVASSEYKISRQLPVWSVFAAFSTFWVATFLTYYFLLDSKTSSVLMQLDKILH